MNSKEMPKYRSHKIVWALKIKSIKTHESGGATICPEDDGYDCFDVLRQYVNKHNPQEGGYFVVYEDGYQSYSPAKAFEKGYTKI